MTHLKADYTKEITELTKGINYCNEAICSKHTEKWEKKEYQAVKLMNMKRKITLIKILKTI